jgi:hypothetical protein
VTARQLTVAHQAPGECAYCDERHARIVAAVAHELADVLRAEADRPQKPNESKAGARYRRIQYRKAADHITPKETP